MIIRIHPLFLTIFIDFVIDPQIYLLSRSYQKGNKATKGISVSHNSALNKMAKY